MSTPPPVPQARASSNQSDISGLTSEGSLPPRPAGPTSGSPRLNPSSPSLLASLSPAGGLPPMFQQSLGEPSRGERASSPSSSSSSSSSSSNPSSNPSSNQTSSKQASSKQSSSKQSSNQEAAFRRLSGGSASSPPLLPLQGLPSFGKRASPPPPGAGQQQAQDAGSNPSSYGEGGSFEGAPPPADSSPPLAASDERQVLLIMLLAQVCSLHDATPRSFVLHVLSLYERGVLDQESIQFLFDLGLVPDGVPPPPAQQHAMLAQGAQSTALAVQDTRSREVQAILEDLRRRESSQLWEVNANPLSLSRYARDFTEIRRLSHGSFGDVFHATNNLDSRGYAIKKVVFDSTGYNSKQIDNVLREVKCLAVCDHPNVVRYYTAWLEPGWMTGGGDPKARGDDPAKQRVKQKLLKNVMEMVAPDLPPPPPSSSNPSSPAPPGADYDLYLGNPMDATDSSSRFQNDKSIISTFSEASASSADSISRDSHPGESSDVLPPLPPKSALDDFVNEWTRDVGGRNVDVSAVSSFDGWDDTIGVVEEGEGEGQDEEDAEDFEEGELMFVVEESTDKGRGGGLGGGMAGRSSGERPPRPNKKKSGGGGGKPKKYQYQICLYIQMQLCTHLTLQDFLRNRSPKTPENEMLLHAFAAFKQILLGLNHIHNNGIIHRDLKPGNIFVDKEGIFKIGDFGLSKLVNQPAGAPPQQSTVPLLENKRSSSSSVDTHTAGIGTASYAAPEQINSTGYDASADVFSLGLILLELCNIFGSDHERARAFHETRRGDIDAKFERRYPDLAALIRACCHKDPTRRPTVADILAADIFKEGEVTRAEVNVLEEALRDRDLALEDKERRIRQLEEKLREMELEQDLS